MQKKEILGKLEGIRQKIKLELSPIFDHFSERLLPVLSSLMMLAVKGLKEKRNASPSDALVGFWNEE